MKRPVVITTRGNLVLFGYIEMEPNREVMHMTDARHVFSWAAYPDGGGLFALATRGPAKGSKIGDVVPRLAVFDIALVIDASQGEKAWKSASWF